MARSDQGREPMRLAEALRIAHGPVEAAASDFRLALICSFTPLHLETFVAARLRGARPNARPAIRTGLYGDLRQGLVQVGGESLDGAMVCIEWHDLDPRLGLRSLGGWGEASVEDICANAVQRLGALQPLIERLPAPEGVIVSLPTLPLPALQPTVPTVRAGVIELRLREAVNAFALRVAVDSRVKIVSSSWIDQASSPSSRFDARSELISGFPYTLAHADALAEAMTALLAPAAPKKGLITDLDETFWKGIVGEVGPANVGWSLEHGSHLHGVYQAFLRSLSEMGVLIAVASKNDASVVDEAFQRGDLILPKDAIFPMEVHWRPKSESVQNILAAWNISADSVVFVDDTAAEIAEVQAVHPQIEGLQFTPSGEGFHRLLARLRDLFAKPVITDDDRIRLESVRGSHHIRTQAGGSRETGDKFHAQAGSILTLKSGRNALDARTVELINKTNQFNLNGQRHTEAAMRMRLADARTFLLKASYEDKYGPLGTIAVVVGHRDDDDMTVDSWVMSCRAFSRRIEHACLDYLFRRFDVPTISFNFMATERNGPLRGFFEELLGEPPSGPFVVMRDTFRANCAPLFHEIKEEVLG